MELEDIKIGSKWKLPDGEVIFQVWCVADTLIPGNETVVYKCVSSARYYTSKLADWPCEFKEV